MIPCYNEANRLDLASVVRFLDAEPSVYFAFVDDGSRDQTAEILDAFVKTNPRCQLIRMPHNVGKSEAVRRGMLAVLEQGAEGYIGFLDADFSTPLSELGHFSNVFEVFQDVWLVMGSRVKLLGRKVERKRLRHYLGRLFATFASMSLNLSVYDTQCGAKFFVVWPGLKDLLAEPFMSRWIFDVELIARFLIAVPNAEARIYELPLNHWEDIGGSKLKITDFFRAFFELGLIYLWKRRREARAAIDARYGKSSSLRTGK